MLRKMLKFWVGGGGGIRQLHANPGTVGPILTFCTFECSYFFFGGGGEYGGYCGYATAAVGL